MTDKPDLRELRKIVGTEELAKTRVKIKNKNVAYDIENLNKTNETFKKLEGKTIIKAEVLPIDDCYDDLPYLRLTFSDKTSVTISANYGGHTGESEDEYIRYIHLLDNDPLELGNS